MKTICRQSLFIIFTIKTGMILAWSSVPTLCFSLNVTDYSHDFVFLSLSRFIWADITMWSYFLMEMAVIESFYYT